MDEMGLTGKLWLGKYAGLAFHDLTYFLKRLFWGCFRLFLGFEWEPCAYPLSTFPT